MEEQEIDLDEFFRYIILVIIKRLKLIGILTGSVALIALIMFLFEKPSFESNSIIELAKMEGKSIESSEALRSLLTNPVEPYLKVLANKLNVSDDDIESFSMSFKIKDLYNYVKISAIAATPEKSKETVDTIRTLIIDRENELLKDAVSIKNTELEDLKIQVDNAEKYVDKLTEKASSKENTTILAQGYVYQAILTERQNTVSLKNVLSDKLRTKEMDIKYYTKPTKIVAESTLPKKKLKQGRVKRLFIIILITLISSILIALIIEHIEKIKYSNVTGKIIK